MTNQLGKFLPNLADLTKPVHDLNKRSQWYWEEPQKPALSAIKDALCSTPILALYNSEQDTVVSADASSYGLGAVLRQKQPNEELRAVAYISRAMTPLSNVMVRWRRRPWRFVDLGD